MTDPFTSKVIHQWETVRVLCHQGGLEVPVIEQGRKWQFHLDCEDPIRPNGTLTINPHEWECLSDLGQKQRILVFMGQATGLSLERGTVSHGMKSLACWALDHPLTKGATNVTRKGLDLFVASVLFRHAMSRLKAQTQMASDELVSQFASNPKTRLWVLKRIECHPLIETTPKENKIVFTYRPAATDLNPEVFPDHIDTSDAAMACGLDPFKTRYTGYLEKIGQATPKLNDLRRSDPLMKAFIGSRFYEETGVKLSPIEQQVHEVHTFLIAQPDWVVNSSRGKHKIGVTTLFYQGDRLHQDYGPDGSEHIPLNVFIQCMHNMMVTGWPEWWVLVWSGTVGLQTHRVHRNQTAMDLILLHECDFWQCVQDKIPPPIDKPQSCHPRCGINETESTVITLKEAQTVLDYQNETSKEPNAETVRSLFQGRHRLMVIIDGQPVEIARNGKTIILKTRGMAQLRAFLKTDPTVAKKKPQDTSIHWIIDRLKEKSITNRKASTSIQGG